MDRQQLQPLQGMTDLTAPEIALWQTLEEKARRLLDLYGFEEIRTPVLERTDVFTHSLGETTDVVSKEMYSFHDQGGREICLRPEGTAGVVRHVAGGGPEALESRLFYIGPMFRAEKPQAGRKRQFHQVGVEIFGPANPYADAECIALQAHLLAEWGLADCAVHVNTRGLPEDQKPVTDGLRDALRPHMNELCEDCRRRFDVNVLRTLDCKQPGCRTLVEALPEITSFMGEAARRHFGKVRDLLGPMGVTASVQPRLVRGFDYYIHTVWEITHTALGAQDALSGGGRYVIDFGKKAVEGVGFAIGMERIVAVLTAAGTAPAAHARPHGVWIISLGEEAVRENMVLARQLREKGVKCGMDLGMRGMKAQMRAANRSGAPWAVIRGADELAKSVCVLKDMKTGDQAELALTDLLTRLTAAG
ncbi:MAG: histidine--tRNA ligase [Kiritimatiellae bacterium]|nr:histidine--tRNA ligase [Kiritimatiellia bacterium]